MSGWKALLAVVLIFLAGAAAGALVARRIAPPLHFAHVPSREAMVERINNRLARQLDLSEQQRAEIGAILRDTRTELAEIRRVTAPRVRKVLVASQERIRERLTAEQRVKFDSLVRHRWWRIDRSELLGR